MAGLELSRSRFGTLADPAEGTLSPAIWLPLTLLSLCCVLFLSLRRAHTLQLYARATHYAREHLPFLASPSPRTPRGIRLPSSDLETGLPDSDSDVDADADDLPAEGSDDELPSRAPAPRLSVAQKGVRGARTVLDTLGWMGRSVGPGRLGTCVGTSQSGTGPGASAVTASPTAAARTDHHPKDKDAGIARAFWGVRKQDRSGQIRLGDNAPLERPRSGPPPSLLGRRAAPILPPTSPLGSGASPLSPRSPRASSVPNLFDLGEEEGEGEGEGEQDAQELSHEFSLPPLGGTGRTSGADAWSQVGAGGLDPLGGGSAEVKGGRSVLRGMQRLE